MDTSAKSEASDRRGTASSGQSGVGQAPGQQLSINPFMLVDDLRFWL